MTILLATKNTAQQTAPTPLAHPTDRLFYEMTEALGGLVLRAMDRVYDTEVMHHMRTLLDVRHDTSHAPDTTQHYAIYESLCQTLDAAPKVQAALMEARAKWQDICAIARKHSTVAIIKAEQGELGSSADDITYTLMHFRYQGVKAHDVQRYLDELAAKFSITSHPTNMSSVAHTVAALHLERILADTQATPQQIHDAVDSYVRAPMAAARKTPVQELEELIPIFDHLFDASLLQRDAINHALKQSGYADDGVQIRTPMVELEDWSASFDGDGNANATRTAMIEGVKRKRAWIQSRYVQMLDKAIAYYETEPHYGTLVVRLQHIKRTLLMGGYGCSDLFLAALDEFKRHELTALPFIDDIIYQARTFSFIGSIGNIRHDAQSLTDALDALIVRANIALATPYRSMHKEERLVLLRSWWNEEQTRTALRHAVTLPASEGESEQVQRMVDRLCYVASDPECANKFIIAEATHRSDAYAALTLLDATGNQVANPHAKQEIVLLVESVEDVERLPDMIRDLASEPVMQRHYAACKRITVMIAHSDNRRRDGYSAGEVITRIEGKLFKLQQDLWIEAVHHDWHILLTMADRFGIPIYVFDGGGNDLMRGAAVNPGQTGKQHGHAAAREHAPTIRTPQNTIQGDQARLLFGFPECAAMFLEMMVSQTMYAKAAVEKRIGVLVEEHHTSHNSAVYQHQRTLAHKLLSSHYQQQQAQAHYDAILFHDTARKAFRAYTYPLHDRDNPFSQLFAHSGAWVSALLANRSSRSNQRGRGDAAQQHTAGAIRGARTPLEQRAITGNLLFQLTGIYHLGLLGQLEAFERIGDEAAHHMFHSSLPDRTHMVGAAQQLQMTNFTKAWQMMGERPPSALQRELYAEEFRYARAHGTQPTTKQILAFLEHYGLCLAKKLYFAATGQYADACFADPRHPFTMRDVYRTLLPELARQIDRRHTLHEPEHYMLARLEHHLCTTPDAVISETLELTIVSLVCALSHDIRPALGPLAVRGAKGVATTMMEQAAMHHERAQPDIRRWLLVDDYQPYDPNVCGALRAAVQSPFSNASALHHLEVPRHIMDALYDVHPH